MLTTWDPGFPVRSVLYTTDGYHLGFEIRKLVYVTNLWTPGLPDGVLGNRPCPSVRPSVCPSVLPSVLKLLGNRSLDFSEILHEVTE